MPYKSRYNIDVHYGDYEDKKAYRKAYARAYYLVKQEEIKAKTNKYYHENTEAVKAVVRERLDRKREEIYRKNRERWARNAERYKRASARWRKENKERKQQLDREYKQSHPEKVREGFHRRRARERNAEGCFTQADINKIKRRQKNRCVGCDVDIRKNYTIDHILPLSKGGTNWPSNLQLLCSQCNSEKHTTDPYKWAQKKLGKLFV